MTVDVRGARPSTPDDASIKDMLAAFRRGSTLVDAALSALAVLKPSLESLNVALVHPRLSKSPGEINRAILALGPILDTAAAESDNLLLTPRGRATAQPLVVFTLARQASGAMSVQSIEIDRAAIALSDGAKRESALVYDRLTRAGRGVVASPDMLPNVRTALADSRAQRTLAVSRLSIAKARFDLQSSFLNAVAQAGAAAPVVRLESHLNGTDARDMALETRRLLSRQSINIANGNRDTLRDLLKARAANSAR